jgi:hypothetical protein
MKFFDKSTGVKVKLPRRTENGMKRLRISYDFTNDEGKQTFYKTMIPVSPDDGSQILGIKDAISNQSVRQVYEAIKMDMPENLVKM